MRKSWLCWRVHEVKLVLHGNGVDLIVLDVFHHAQHNSRRELASCSGFAFSRSAPPACCLELAREFRQAWQVQPHRGFPNLHVQPNRKSPMQLGPERLFLIHQSLPTMVRGLSHVSIVSMERLWKPYVSVGAVDGAAVGCCVCLDGVVSNLLS